jgi:methyl-accepting chemotaxis protein
VGAVAAAMTTVDLSRTVATWRNGKTGYAYLLDEQGKVLSHPRKELVATMADQRSHPVVQAASAAGGSSRMVSFPGQDERAFLGVARTTKCRWMVGIEQAEEEVFEGVRQTRLVGIVLLLVAMVLVAVVAWRTALSLVRPIVKLTELADRMSMGETNLELDVHSNDEIGMLAKSFGRLQVSLRKAMARLN